MKKTREILFLIIFVFGIILFSNNVFAAEYEITTTTTDSAGNVFNWKYNDLSNNGKINNLVCTSEKNSITGEIEIPSTIDGKTVVSIGTDAFKGFTLITGIKIPSSVKSILGTGAFKNCTSLKNVDLGSIEMVNYDTFANCTSLESITIPKTLNSGLPYGKMFSGCDNLTEIILEEGLEIIDSGIVAGTNVTNIEIPSSAKAININAFSNCKELKKITILDNITTMGYWTEGITNDSIFLNHNEDLKIYCYKDSVAHKYAVATNIKYVLLDKTNTNEEETEENKTEENKTEEKVDAKTEKDNTIATTELPKTGKDFVIFGLIGIVILIGIVGVKKYSKYRDIN